MKVMQWMLYFLIFNGVLSLFLNIGLYGQAAALGVPQNQWAISGVQDFVSLTGFSGIGSIGLGVLTMIIAIKGGINPFMSMAYGVMTGLFLNIWLKVFATMSNIRNWISTSNPSAASTMDGVMALLVTIVAILFVYTLVQMAIGGTESYE
jgi:hypothetical protein